MWAGFEYRKRLKGDPNFALEKSKTDNGKVLVYTEHAGEGESTESKEKKKKRVGE